MVTRAQAEKFIEPLVEPLGDNGFFATTEDGSFNHLQPTDEVDRNDPIFMYCPLGDSLENCLLIMGDLGVTWTPPYQKGGGGRTECLETLDLSMDPGEVVQKLIKVWNSRCGTARP